MMDSKTDGFHCHYINRAITLEENFQAQLKILTNILVIWVSMTYLFAYVTLISDFQTEIPDGEIASLLERSRPNNIY